MYIIMSVIDLLEETSTVSLWPHRPYPFCGHIFLDVIPTSSVLVGSTQHINSVHVLDLPSKTTLFNLVGVYDHTSFLHCLQFLSGPSSGAQFVTCAGSGGEISVWDSRTNPAKTSPTQLPPLHLPGNTKYSLAATGGGAQPGMSAEIARLASDGRVDLFDLRHPGPPAKTAYVVASQEKNFSIGTKFTEENDDPLPCVQVRFRWYQRTKSFIPDVQN